MKKYELEPALRKIFSDSGFEYVSLEHMVGFGGVSSSRVTYMENSGESVRFTVLAPFFPENEEVIIDNIYNVCEEYLTK